MLKNLIKLIIFDLDGVLIEAKEIHYRSLKKALKEHYQNRSPFIDNNLDPLVWSMGCNGTIYDDGSCIGEIYTNFCQTVCHIIDD